MEKVIIETLQRLKDERKYISLSLHPAIGNNTISRENNRLRINEGRDGEYSGVSENFYDGLVDEFDSRYRGKSETE